MSDENMTIEDNGDFRIIREWHENGQLIKESRFKKRGENSWVDHGESKQWSSDGELIGTYTVHEGTGVVLDWYDNGQLKSEVSMVGGEIMGLMSSWDETGYLIVDQFFYKSKQVSKKKYKELQESDPAIPQYPEEAFATVTQKRKKGAPLSFCGDRNTINCMINACIAPENMDEFISKKEDE